MDNPFSKVKQAYKDSEFGLKRQLKKEAKGLGPDFDANEVIQSDDEFAEFLIGINPNYANMDLENKANIQIVREKYLLYQEHKRVKGDVQEVFKTEVMEGLGVDIPDDKLGPALEQMGQALKELAQKNTLEFQKLRNKIAEYQKIQSEVKDLQDKFQEKVGMKGGEGMQAMKDRKGKLDAANMKFFSKAGFEARVNHISGDRDVVHAVADFKHTYDFKDKELKAEMDASGGDIKKMEKLQQKMDELRQFIFNDLKITKAVIESAQLAAKEALNAQVKELNNEDQFDFMSRADRAAYKKMLVGRQSSRALTPEENAEITRLGELEYMDGFEDDPASMNEDQKVQLKTWREQQAERSKKRISKLESVRKLVAKMTEGKGKKGGIDFTKNVGAEQITIKDLMNGVDRQVDGSVKANLEKMIQDEVRVVIERAAVRSPRLAAFRKEVGGYFEQWRIGGLDSRDKVREFMVKTMKDVCNNGDVNPVLKVQLKAFLAQRGLNPVSYRIP